MALRRYRHYSPGGQAALGPWPDVYLDAPGAQFAILRHRYRDQESGCIPLPETTQQLWARHRYSVLARHSDSVQRVVQQLTHDDEALRFGALAPELVTRLRQPPAGGQLLRALVQMHRKGHDEELEREVERPDASAIRTGLLRRPGSQRSVLQSTALGDLAFWLGETSSVQGGAQ